MKNSTKAIERQTHASGRRIRPAAAVLVALLALSPAIAVIAARLQAQNDPSPATGHAEVIAQGIALVNDEPMVWRVVQQTARLRDEATFGRRPFGFVLATDAPILLSNRGAEGTTYEARLAPGESSIVLAGTLQQRASLSDAPVPYLVVELVPEADADDVGSGILLFMSATFPGLGGDRDVDLVRDVLAAGETTSVPDSGTAVVILATDGAIDVLPEGGRSTTLQAGEAATFTGALTIQASTAKFGNARRTNAQAGTQGGIFVAAVIGPEIPPVATAIPTEVVAPPTLAPTLGPTLTPEPTLLPTEPPPPSDSDGDGLLDLDEPEFGTDPFDPDTDDDDLLDGDEVFFYGTDPLNRDTDGDTLPDGTELGTYATDPLNPDTDGDQWTDAEEVSANTDPLDPESYP